MILVIHSSTRHLHRNAMDSIYGKSTYHDELPPNAENYTPVGGVPYTTAPLPAHDDDDDDVHNDLMMLASQMPANQVEEAPRATEALQTGAPATSTTSNSSSASSSNQKSGNMPTWLIVVIILGVLSIIGFALYVRLRLLSRLGKKGLRDYMLGDLASNTVRGLANDFMKK